MEHSFNTEFAREHGVNAAVLYRNFQYWIAKNKANGHNFQDGRVWTYNSMRALADLFPYLSIWEVRKALKTLTDEGILLKANYNTKGYDRTMWYAFKDEKTALKGLPAHLCNPQMDCAKSTNGLRKTHKSICESHTPIPNIKPNSKPDIKPNNNVEISAQEILDLDLIIAGEKNFFMGRIEEILRPSRREARTFANITRYLVEQCQRGSLKPSIFKDAVEWAMQASSSYAANQKGLFVAKVKQETGFMSQKRLLRKVQQGRQSAAV